MPGKRLFRFLFILSALSLLGMLFVYPSLPTMVPTNWNLEGKITSWGHKWTNLLLGGVPFLIALGLRFVPHIDPRGKNFKKYPKAYNAISTVTVVALIALSWAVTLPCLGVGLPVDKLIMILVGVMLIGMGNYMPQVQSNFFMGFRTPWALSDEVVWRKTHRAAGVLFCVSGILMVAAVLFPPPVSLVVPMGVLLVGCVGVTIYSYLIYTVN